MRDRRKQTSDICLSNTEALAQKILFHAAEDTGGHCYPSQVSNEKLTDLDAALRLLEIYGRTHLTKEGASPIFTINDAGRCFLNMGAWRGKKETEKNNREQMKLMEVNNKLVKWSIITTILLGILTSLVTWYCSKS